MADQPPGTSGQMVLLEKGTPQIAIDPIQHPTSDSRQNPVDCRAFNSVLVDVIAAQTGTAATTITVIGSPFGTEPWVQEWDPNALQNVAAGTNKRFLVTGVSAFVAVELTSAAGWRVVLTPLDSPGQTTLNFTATSSTNLTEVGGAAIGPANPVPVAQQGTANLNLAQVGGVNLTLGQKTAAASVPVVIASDQSAVTTQLLHPAATSGTFTTTSTAGTSVVGPVSMVNLGSAIVTVHGTYGAGLQIAFEADDGSGNWYPVQASRADSAVAESASVALAANQSQAWELDLGGFTNFRVRDLANPASGSATITIIPTAESADPVVTAIGQAGSGALTDGSGTITTGGTAQTVFAANPKRRYLLIQNISTASMWVNFGVAATQGAGSLQLTAGGSIVMESSFVDSELVSIIGPTTGQAFTAKQG